LDSPNKSASYIDIGAGKGKKYLSSSRKQVSLQTRHWLWKLRPLLLILYLL